MLHSLRILTSLLATLFLLTACIPAAPVTTDAPTDEERPRVVVSVLPLANIVYNIGGDRIDLDAIMPPGTAPHTFEPRPSDAVKLAQADLIFVTLAEHDPDNRGYYESNFSEYAARLVALDEAIQAATATIPESNRRLLTYHDSFGYFAFRYGYTVIGAIQPNDTSQPSAKEVAALIDQLREEGVPAIFGSILFPADVIDQIASETGVTVSTLLDDGLPGGPDDPEHTYIGMMVENMRTLASTLGGDPYLMDGVDVGNVPDSE